VFTKCDEKTFAVFERKILRAIYGAIKDNDEWRIRYNSELYALYKNMDIITFIKVGRLKWAGHVVRMDQRRPAKRILNAKLECIRRRGRPKLRWEDGVDKDVKTLEERNWKNIARNREIWQKLLRKAMAQKGLLCR
jgi:hypothetical protein